MTIMIEINLNIVLFFNTHVFFSFLYYNLVLLFFIYFWDDDDVLSVYSSITIVFFMVETIIFN